MPLQFNPQHVHDLSEQLNHHPVYGLLRDLKSLRRFMSYHIFSVWDFMSLIKYLQQHIAPSEFPWIPRGSPTSRRFINSLVLEEESDEGMLNNASSYTSHFELYCMAMREVGADPQPALQFVDKVRQEGIEIALHSELIPNPSRHFTQTTFEFLHSGKPHTVAAALAIGREQVIPNMFREFLKKMAITTQEAPAFHYYLKRHIHLDEDFHAPFSLQLLNELCYGEEQKVNEAEAAAKTAILARLRFWDEVAEEISL